MKIADRVEIAAPCERVWELTLDIESWPSFTPTITSVERLDAGSLAVGAQALVRQPGQPRRTWTVTDLDVGRRFAWSTAALGTVMTGVHELAPTATGTLQELTVELDGRVAPLVGVLIRNSIRKALAAENAGFKAAAEGDAA